MIALLDRFTHSETAHDVSLVLVHSLWQGTVVAVALAILLRQMRRSSAQARYLASCVGMLALVVWPAVTFWQVTGERGNVVRAPWPHALNVSAHEQPLLHLRAPQAPPSTSTPSFSPSWKNAAIQPRAASDWQSWATLLWLTGMALLSVWHLMGWLSLQRLRYQAASALTGELASISARLARHMKLPSSTRVRWSSRVTGAISFGWLRPMVLLPAAMATGFSTREIEMILAHEFAHLRRHDYLVNLLQSAVETLLFYHPAVWWTSRQMRREREHACDDIAIRVTGDARSYAHALVRLAESATAFSEGTPRLAMAAGAQSGLRGRIERLICPATPSTAFVLRPASSVVILTLVLLGVGIPDASRPLQAQDTTATALRGTIRDRNGVPLAISDREDRQIIFDLEKVVDAWRAKPGREVPLRIYRKSPTATDDGPDEVEEPDIVYMFEQLAPPALEQHQLARSFNAGAMRRHYRQYRGSRPFAYEKELSEDEFKHAASVKDKVIGMDVRTVMLRHYPYKALAGHMLGYTRHSGSDEPEEGASGLESSLHSLLEPQPLEDESKPSPARGADVYLTLDARHQYIAERALRDCVPAIGRGTAVLLDVQSGDVLAMASVPSFDPNDFIPFIRKEKLENYNNNTTNPLLNRAIRSFVPGATFLVATSLAGICDGKEGFQHTCTGGSTFGNRYMQCWIGQKGSTHGAMDLRKGIQESCNPYFYNLGNAINPDKYDAIVSLLGIGQDVGIELPENDRGIFPNRAWWAKYRPREPYTAATVANWSIGQGAMQVSPLQLASLMVPVANGGLVWRPRLVDRIASGGEVAREEKRPRQLVGNLRDEGLTDTGLQTLRTAMRATVTDGVAQAANLPDLPMAGRTGTAQNWRHDEKGNSVKDNHTMFIAYAPVERPRWAICVLVQGGKGGGTTAAPIAAHILRQVAEVETGKRKVEVQPVEPIEGSFEPIDHVEYPSASN
ncbi:cell division protein FtsI/penicillin-binding protein 2 [Roseimicrobium gellanilyticum]|uniref:beta-lactamase n=1 Tax=Roseimicrobium gellanilyticum TaxID=748857 RepID=A0A366HRB2_9BACT|nr:penicillin-binding transpeptidase domain-containing protein [Roseimicrobium gellanilyticum]RBP46205.1 cell division protein FtsI/penicillin-binding protein 2 [Roseimicrobium gellanilyticum]